MMLINNYLTICFLVIVFTLSIGFGIPEIYSQPNPQVEKPLTSEEVQLLLKSKGDQNRLIAQIRSLKVDFDIYEETDTYRELVLAGASNELILALKNNQYVDLLIITPKSGSDVGATVKVEGKSKFVAEKHLWVFAHREGLGIWWPQGGEVGLKENGEWRQGVFLGQQRDVGFDFEIVAMWVNKKENRVLMDNLANGEKTGSYPGIPLPGGFPKASVTVHKVRH